MYCTDNTLRIGTSALAGQTTALYLYLLPSLHNSAMLENDIIYFFFKSDIFCWWRCNNKFALMFIMYDTIDMQNLDANLNHIFVNDYDEEQFLS